MARVLVAEPERMRRLQPGDPARVGGGAVRLDADDLACPGHVLGGIGHREVAERLVVARPGAGLQQQRAGGDRAAGDHHQVTLKRAFRCVRRAADWCEHRLAYGLLAAGLDDGVA